MENKIRIYGNQNCWRCESAKAAIPEAEYFSVEKIYDHLEIDQATAVCVASNGELPIILIPTATGFIAFRPTIDSGASECVGGVCSLPTAKESSHGQGKGKK